MVGVTVAKGGSGFNNQDDVVIVPLTAVQQLLGHAGLNTTQIYLRMTGSGLHDAVQAAEIRALLRDVDVRPERRSAQAAPPGQALRQGRRSR